jgi:hypothetical protein
MFQFLKASNDPFNDIEKIAYPGQPEEYRMYKQGYEDFFNLLPVMYDNDRLLPLKLQHAGLTMQALAKTLSVDPWLKSMQPLPGGFNRTILGLEAPQVLPDGDLKEGQEVIVARWGDGKSSPVHGHGDGLLYEQLIYGQMRVNTYRIVDKTKRIARPLETEIYTGFENIANSYTKKQLHVRSALVHNFTSIGTSASLHFVPEHTRDGRDNKFEVEYFEQQFSLYPQSLKQLKAQEGIEQLKIGDVALVRSQNVPAYGDHFIVITGAPIMKEHGLRPQDVAIHAPYAAQILDHYDPIMGLTLLKLRDEAKRRFHAFHGINVIDGRVIFPIA